jgi:CheY-like chemotaxis protein
MTTAASHSGDGVSIAHGLVLTVLLVDDEIDARGIVKRVMEMNGATVSAAGSASEAMERIPAGRPDMLVCEVGVPGKTAIRLSGGCEF